MNAVSHSHAVIGETLRVSTFFTSFVADKYQTGAVMVEADSDRIDWAVGVIDEWDNREQRRGRPWDRALEAAAILGLTDKFANNPYVRATIDFATVETVCEYEAALISVMRKASKIEKLGRESASRGDLDTAAKAEAVLTGYRELAEQILADLKDAAGAGLWREWVENDGKSHLDGVSAAKRNNRGTAWTSSRKGYATTIRYDDSADYAPTLKRGAIDAGEIFELDEDALAELADEAARDAGE